ncbi:ABC transporter ATP-binding protein [Marinobacter sp. NP-4(2019)]|uniref:ABC transporter ATP-binding protein n=1 Tax=Marinobacter sp. NP-4(2019) TaxID=2488665 RepID=UPI000FC3CFF5|nr:ABC transporter ATP-binding protein [Marinobacter sp. NP-4(2019)]AZT85226.1 ABC transporter ATP-binding protein [Marinobacter sp. NP-4(2019)]
MTKQTPGQTLGSEYKQQAVTTRGLGYQWPQSHVTLPFPDITLARGEHLFIKGPSGSGKSTLLSLLAGMLSPTSGTVSLLGKDITPFSNGQRDRFRADHMGVIFQQFNLVPYLTTLGNVTLPCRLSAKRHQLAKPEPSQEAGELLAELAIPHSHWHQPVTRLSVGQQQRVAAARALIGHPELILADEPTSALDTDNRDRFIELLLTLAQRAGSSVIFVSHDQGLASHFDHELFLEVQS